MLARPGVVRRERQVDEKPQVPAPQQILRPPAFDPDGRCTEANQLETREGIGHAPRWGRGTRSAKAEQ